MPANKPCIKHNLYTMLYILYDLINLFKVNFIIELNILLLVCLFRRIIYVKIPCEADWNIWLTRLLWVRFYIPIWNWYGVVANNFLFFFVWIDQNQVAGKINNQKSSKNIILTAESEKTVHNVNSCLFKLKSSSITVVLQYYFSVVLFENCWFWCREKFHREIWQQKIEKKKTLSTSIKYIAGH